MKNALKVASVIAPHGSDNIYTTNKMLDGVCFQLQNKFSHIIITVGHAFSPARNKILYSSNETWFVTHIAFAAAEKTRTVTLHALTSTVWSP